MSKFHFGLILQSGSAKLNCKMALPQTTLIILGFERWRQNRGLEGMGGAVPKGPPPIFIWTSSPKGHQRIPRSSPAQQTPLLVYPSPKICNFCPKVAIAGEKLSHPPGFFCFFLNGTTGGLCVCWGAFYLGGYILGTLGGQDFNGISPTQMQQSHHGSPGPNAL